MNKTLLFMALFLIVSGQMLMAQNSTVKGRVTDENGLPMAGATVLLTDLGAFGAIVDVQGNFVILKVPAGDHQLRLSFIGYNTVEQTITALEGETLTLDFTMASGITVGNEVMILGERLKGQAKALNQQRTNTNITNVVNADQIGRFPDANIGDAIKRMPGITIQMDQGEARNLIIRGLAPQLNSVMINGERIPSAEGDNRNVQMDLIPSDMIQTIQVNKAVTPDMDADAIGGAVNLITRAAPSGTRISGTLASGYNFLSEKPIWTGGLIAGDRFLNDKLGAILSLSYNNHQLGSDNIEFEWDNEAEDDLEEDVGVDPYIVEMDNRKYRIQRVRRSASLNLDYKLDENNTIIVRSMYNWRDDRENRYRFQITDIAPIFEDGEMTGDYQGAYVRELKGGIGNDRNDNRRLEDQRVRTGSISGQHLLGGLELNWMMAYAKASEERLNERYVAFETDDDIPVLVDINNSKFPIAKAESPVGLSSYELDEITEENQYTEEEDINAKIDLQLPVYLVEGLSGKLKFGGRLRSKTKSRENNFAEYVPTGGINEGDAHSIFGGSWNGEDGEFEDLTLDRIPTLDHTDADYLPGSKYQIGSFASAAFIGGLDLQNDNLYEKEDKPDEYLADNYNAKETVTGGYLMLNQELTTKFSAIVGLRFENTFIEYTGNVIENEDELMSTITEKDSYSNVMPGLHLKYDFNPNFILRAAWTNTLARPNYYDLVPYEDDRIDEELYLGNPNLKPTTSMNFDLMAENYFESIGLISGGIFHKNVKDFIYPSSLEREDGVEVFQAKNGAEASITGVEVAFQRQLDFLPGVLRGLGVYLNYTYTTSIADGITDEDGGLRDDLDLPGTAKNLFNASLSFETKKLTLRASLNYSGDYIDEVGGSAFTDRYYDEQIFLDINGAYAVTPQLRLFFEANNLTNQPLRYYQGVSERTMQAEYYNVKFNAGLKFDLFK